MRKLRIYWRSYSVPALTALQAIKDESLGFWICSDCGFLRGFGETPEQAYYEYLRKLCG